MIFILDLNPTTKTGLLIIGIGLFFCLISLITSFSRSGNTARFGTNNRAKKIYGAIIGIPFVLFGIWFCFKGLMQDETKLSSKKSSPKAKGSENSEMSMVNSSKVKYEFQKLNNYDLYKIKDCSKVSTSA